LSENKDIESISRLFLNLDFPINRRKNKVLKINKVKNGEGTTLLLRFKRMNKVDLLLAGVLFNIHDILI